LAGTVNPDKFVITKMVILYWYSNINWGRIRTKTNWFSKRPTMIPKRKNSGSTDWKMMIFMKWWVQEDLR
jgi:hypothetical protein